MTERILYLDLFSGIAGDMTLAALVDLGADQTRIQDQLNRLYPKKAGFKLHFQRTLKKGATGLQLKIDFPPEDHHHRTYASILKDIQSAEFSPYVTEKASEIFRLIAEAEAKIHGVELEKVHFHEVGALDSLADILGVCLAMEQLKPDRILSSPVALGSGMVDCQHGSYPVPALASLEILKGFPLRPSAEPFELTTPTGAGILKCFVEEVTPGIPAMTIEGIGYGAGNHDLHKQPNILRAILGRSLPQE